MEYSVLLSVYQKERAEYLRLAMDSIWKQTVGTDDFVLVCDGPLTPELDAVIEEMEREHPDTLRVVRLKENGGLGNALNAGLAYCRHELVARMDSDDIACPDRCERQLQVFREHPEIGLCSGTVIEFVESPDKAVGRRELPLSHEELLRFSRRRNPCNHPSVMFRKSEVEAAGGYNEKYHLFEDYYLWVRMLMKGTRARNIQAPVLYMRTPADFYDRRGGIAYAKDMLAFHWWMKETGWISMATFLTGAVPHAVVCVLPSPLRRAVYKLLRG